MIETMRLKFGRSPGQSPEDITVAPLTVFVGPNNSGKSKVLAEINQFCRTGTTDQNFVILEQLSFDGLDAEETRDGRLIGFPLCPMEANRCLSNK